MGSRGTIFEQCNDGGHQQPAVDVCPTLVYRNRLAITQDELSLAQQIRYTAYVSAGWLDTNHENKFGDDFDLMPNSFTHLTFHLARCVGTMRTNVFTGERGWDCVPSSNVFGDCILSHVKGERFVELSRFAIVADAKLSARQAQLAQFNSAVYAADHHNCRYMLAAVRDSHVPFYQRLHFVAVESAREYPGLKFKTALMVMDWKFARPRLLEHPIFHVVFKFRRDPVVSV